MSSSIRNLQVRLQGRLHKISCDSRDSLLSVLDRVCEKTGTKSEEYELVRCNKAVDLSSSLELARIPNNCTLDAAPSRKIRIETDVNAVVQLIDGSRVSENFPPKTSLAEVLTKTTGIEYSADSGLGIVYAQREISGEESLRKTTLRTLGLIGGRALLRVVRNENKEIRIELESSTASKVAKTIESDTISAEKKEISSSTVPELSSDDGSEVKMSKVDSQPATKDESETKPEKFETGQSVDLSGIAYLGERKALAYSQKTIADFRLDDLPDDFFELTTVEMQKLMADLVSKRMELENKPLQISSVRDVEDKAKREEKLKKYKIVVIRVHFPDQTVLQGLFEPKEKIKDVEDFVKSHIQVPMDPFHLFTTPPKKILDPNLTLLDCDCVPNAMIYFSYDDLEQNARDQFLCKQILDNFSTPEVALTSAYAERGISAQQGKKETKGDSKANTKISQSLSKEKVPKWFKPL